LLHIVELKDQDCKVFYEKLKFIYLELPKFKKSIDQLNDHFDKWLFLLKHLPDLEEPPLPLQENVFMQLFEVAQITGFSPEERDAYENSLKYYRDMKGVVETAREEGIAQGMQEGKAIAEQERLIAERANLEKQQAELAQRQAEALLKKYRELFGDIPE
jgi:predicted transposase/invertase (TIGR01784 family)